MFQDAEQFLAALGGAGPFTFQTFGEGEAKNKSLARIIHGDASSKLHQLKELNDKGAGIFVMVNQGNQKGRSNSNVVDIRAVFIDLDGSPIDPVLNAPLKPHIVIESSPNKYHAYWLVDGLSKDKFKAIQQTLARKFNGDSKVCDLPRVMRVPGFYHKKSTPFLTKILQLNNHPIYKFTQILNAFEISPDISNWVNEKDILEGNRNNSLFVKACGFASKGLDADAVLSRITKINLTHCKPPLENDEVQNTVSQAMSYGVNGSIKIDYNEFDSPTYKALSHGAKVLDLSARRLSKNSLDVTFSLTAKDLASYGFKNPRILARCRDELIIAGFLIEVRSPSYGVSGGNRLCGLFKRSGGFYSQNDHKKKDVL